MLPLQDIGEGRHLRLPCRSPAVFGLASKVAAPILQESQKNGGIVGSCRAFIAVLSDNLIGADFKKLDCHGSILPAGSECEARIGAEAGDTVANSEFRSLLIRQRLLRAVVAPFDGVAAVLAFAHEVSLSLACITSCHGSALLAWIRAGSPNEAFLHLQANHRCGGGIATHASGRWDGSKQLGHPVVRKRSPPLDCTPLKPLSVFHGFDWADALKQANVVFAHNDISTTGFLEHLALAEACDHSHLRSPRFNERILAWVSVGVNRIGMNDLMAGKRAVAVFVENFLSRAALAQQEPGK